MKTQHIIIVICASFLLLSCKKFVTVNSPIGELGTEIVFQNNETANAALLNIYGSMMDRLANPYVMSVHPAMWSDELITWSSGSFLEVYRNAIRSTNSQTNDIWNTAYNYIYQANVLIEGTDKPNGLSKKVNNQILGEALFLRTFWHFYLLNLYGDIPLVLSSDYTKNSILSRSSAEIVYRQLIDDIKKAQILLNENYIGSNSVDVSLERIRPNRYTADGLLARIYLYTRDYDNAVKESTKIIEYKSLYNLVDLDSVFLKNNKEAIWQLSKPTPVAYNTPEGLLFTLVASPVTVGGYNSTTLSPQLLSAFESGDMRKEKWVGKFTDVGVTPNKDYYYPFKYKVRLSSGLTEYSTIFRMSEQYLIRAEAKAILGDLSGAIDDVDVVRKRAGLPLIKNSNPGINGPALIEEITKQRRLEFFAEWGHRWFDLKRLGKADEVMNQISIQKQTIWKPEFKLWPIPQTDIDRNPTLKQNPGYLN